MIYNKEAKTIKKYRIKSKMTQIELAKKLGYTSPQFISNIERGLVALPEKKIVKLCSLISIDIDDFIELRSKTNNDMLLSVIRSCGYRVE